MTIEYLKKAGKTAATGEDDTRKIVADMLGAIEAGGETRASEYAEKLDHWTQDTVITSEEIQAAAEHSGATRLFPQGRGVRMGFKGYLRRHIAIHGNSGDRVDFNHLLPANHISGYRNIFTVNNGS